MWKKNEKIFNVYHFEWIINGFYKKNFLSDCIYKIIFKNSQFVVNECDDEWKIKALSFFFFFNSLWNWKA